MLGGDPEIFLADAKGEPVAAHHYLPRQGNALELNKNFGVYAFRDGFAVEFNVTPKTNAGWIFDDVQTGFRELLNKLPGGMRIIAAPSILVDVSDSASWPDDVCESGCSPSINAYTGEQGVVKLNLREHPWRYGAGHIHFSVKNGDKEEWYRDPNMTVKLLDREVGLEQTIFFDSPTEYARRVHYGRAGEYRIGEYPNQYYGLEYRVPSNTLWTSKPQFEQAVGKIKYVLHNFAKLADEWKPKYESGLQKAINNQEASGFRKWLSQPKVWETKQLDEDAAIEAIERAA